MSFLSSPCLRKCFLPISLLVLSNCICAELTCQQYSQSESSLTYNVCSPFISQEVFINEGRNQSFLDQQLFQSDIFQYIQSAKSILHLDCYKALLSIVCQTTFPTCSSSNQVYPCASSCEVALDTCAYLTPMIGAVPLNCSTNDIGPCSTSIFPPNPAAQYTNPVITSCPTVYALRTSPPRNNEAFCAVRCPDPEFPHAEWRKNGVMNLVVGSISFVLLSFLIVSYLIDFQKRKFPARLQLFVCVSALGLTIGSLMSGKVPYETVMCADEATYSDQSNNHLCATQSAFIMFFAFAIAFWVLALAVVLFLAVSLEYPLAFIKSYEKYFHIVIWGVSLIFTIVAASTKQFNYTRVTLIYCFLVLDYSKKIPDDLPLFYIPITILISFIFIFYIAVLYKLITFKWMSKKGDTTIHLRAQRRVMAIMAITIVLLGIIFVFRYVSTNTVDRNEAERRDEWINCKVRSEIFNTPYPPSCDAPTNPNRNAEFGVIFANVGLATVGIFIFLAFGTNAEIFQQWIYLIKCIYAGDKARISKFFSHGFSSSSIHDSSPTNTTTRRSLQISTTTA